jgi:hypothetical protein
MVQAPAERFIAPDASEIARIRAKHTFQTPTSSRPTVGPNQTAAIDSVGSWSLCSRAKFALDVAYRLARTLHGAEAALCKKRCRRPAKPQ